MRKKYQINGTVTGRASCVMAHPTSFWIAMAHRPSGPPQQRPHGPHFCTVYNVCTGLSSAVMLYCCQLMYRIYFCFGERRKNLKHMLVIVQSPVC